MIEMLDAPRLLRAPGHPDMVVAAVASQPCGCSVSVGFRLDTQEVATSAGWCNNDEHEQVMEHFNMLLRESLVEPTDRLLIEVCDELLEQAFEHHA